MQSTKYQVGRLLGKGCSGAVYEVMRIEDSKKFALKKVSAVGLDDNVVRHAFREASIMKRLLLAEMTGRELRIPWIVSIEDFWVDEEAASSQGIHVNIVIELVCGPTLESYLERMSHPRMKRRSTGGFSRLRPGEDLSDDDHDIIMIPCEKLYEWISQIALALGAIHSLDVIHRDLKPANLILSPDLSAIKLADFSASRVIEKGDTPLDTTAGTLNYAAPEVLQGKPYRESCDLWSFGCVIYEMVMLEKAFKVANTTKILSAIQKGDIPCITDDHEPGLVMLCHRLLSLDQRKRPDAMTLCKHVRLKQYVAVQLGEIAESRLREHLITTLDLSGIIPSVENSDRDAGTLVDGDDRNLIFINEECHNTGCAIDDQFDDDLGCEVLPLMQGAWEIEGSKPTARVEIEGVGVQFSDGRPSTRIYRAFRKEVCSCVEWTLGKSAILIKQHSSFDKNPQRLCFSHINAKISEIGSRTDRFSMVLRRSDPICSVYHSAASTASR
jgi:serine/threonine protein kinase